MRADGPVLVTGADGFVGRHLVALLRARLPAESVHAATFDITDRQAVRDGVRAARPAGCIHLAALSTVAHGRADPQSVWRVNLHGTLHLAQALLDEAPDCRLVHASTAEIYGGSFGAGRALDETALMSPKTTYGASKAAADLALGAMAADGLQVVRLRPFNHTGPGQTDSFVVAAFARQVALIEAGRQPARIEVGDLSPQRDFLDVRDVCEAYAAALERPDVAAGAILNIASGTPRRIGDVLADLLAMAGVEALIVPDPARMRPIDIALAAGDSTRARDLLGWVPRIAWAQTLADVLADWRARVR